MKYNWDMHEIQELKKQIQSYARNNRNLDKSFKSALKDSISILDEMKHCLQYGVDFTATDPKKYMDSNRMLPRDTYQKYKDIPSDIVETIMCAADCFSEYEDDFEYESLPELNISDQELVEMSHDFYKWLEQPYYLAAFEFYTNPKHHLLQFRPYESYEVLGMTYPILFPIRKMFLLVNRTNTILDFITLNHECAHAIVKQEDTIGKYQTQQTYLMELEGERFDSLSIQYLKKYMGPDIIAQLELQNFMSTYNQLKAFYMIAHAVRLYEMKKPISIIPIQQSILTCQLPFDINESDLMMALLEDPINLSTYLLSFLVNLELDGTDEKNPKDTFAQFERIRKSQLNSVFQTLKSNGIACMSENENDKALQKKIEKMNQLMEDR